MTATFTAAGVSPWSPLMIIGDDHARETRTVIHDLINDETPAVSFFPALRRSGTLELLVQDATSAAAALALFTRLAPITLTDTDRPDRSMRFVVGPGKINQRTDIATQRRIIMSVPFQEVPL